MRGPRHVALLLALCAAVLAAVPAAAQDSEAPPGASSGYLPKEQWILRHWIPFDEQVLKAKLGLRGRDLEAFLYNDHRTLAMIAQQRGIAPQALADDLVAPLADGVDGARRALLRERALRIITQGHLAQHIFFHVLHGTRARESARQLFGISPDRYRRMRERGFTPLQAARAGGVSRAHVVAGMTRLLRRDHDEGIAAGMSWPAEADLMLRRQLRALPCWLRRPFPSQDPANPYGKQSAHHHAAKPASERTDAEERHDERRVEHVRRHLARSCWRRPPPWSWGAHGLESPWSGAAAPS